MDSGLKERLVGAVVLVVIAVWLIPWLLNGPDPEPPVEAGGAALSLPAAEDGIAPTRTETIVLGDPGPAAGESDDAPGVATAARELVPVAGAERTASDAATAGAELTAAAGTVAAAATPPAPAPSAKPAAAAAGAAWVVQLGSFGDAANATRLSSRVSTYGYSADVTPYRSGGRTLHRVRVGPWASREEAEAVASALGAHGFVAQVVGAD